jgi:hypothetical protein
MRVNVGLTMMRKSRSKLRTFGRAESGKVPLIPAHHDILHAWFQTHLMASWYSVHICLFGVWRHFSRFFSSNSCRPA